MKLGLLGGTFNPLHLAHLRMAEEARTGAGLDQVLFIPAVDPPHKPVSGGIPFILRYQMVLWAVQDNPCFGVTDLEQRLGGKSYTVDTLQHLRQERPEDELYFIIGSDSYLELGLWHRYQELFELTSFIVLERPDRPITDPLQQLPAAVQGQFRLESPALLRHQSQNSIQFITGTRLEISSSNIRQLVAKGASIRYLVPSIVEEFITLKGLYLHE